MLNLLAGLYTLLLAAYGSVADIEIMLAVITSIGVLFGIYNVRESWRDYLALRKRGFTDHGKNFDPRMVVATNGLKAEISRLLIQLWFLTLAIFAMFIPESPPYVHEPLKLVAFGIIFRWGIIGASMLLTLKSYWGYQVRNRVIERYGNTNGDNENESEPDKPND